MKDLFSDLIKKKIKLDKLPPLRKEALFEMEEWLKVELTYSSNAIEGNTLTRKETAEVIEKGIAAVISGKPLRDQIEAINHAKAVDFIKDLSKRKKDPGQIRAEDINNIHKIILTGINDDWAGRYRETEVFIKGSSVELPQPIKVPYLMDELVQWLSSQKKVNTIKVAADAHYKLVSIHPYVDGNGRTARLLMNLILMINGYPIVIIKNEERLQYLDSLEEAQLKGKFDSYYNLVGASIDRSLEAYINAAENKKILPAFQKKSTHGYKSKREMITHSELLKIGELAKETGETIHTLRYWTKMGLLKVTQYTEGGYQLYSPSVIKQATKIRELQKEKRLTIEEMKTLV